MKSLKSSLIVLTSSALIFLAACSSGTQTSNQNTTPAASQPAAVNSATSTSTTQTPASSVTSTPTETKTGHAKVSKGGQVVETGAYHLELVPLKEAQKTHLDFYLLKGDNHEVVPNAKVTAQIQSPDGTEKTLNLAYDAQGKHYAVVLPDNAPGQYQVKMTADVNGEKVSGRFNFNQ
jgi:glucose/arabinose dehydrogenase